MLETAIHRMHWIIANGTMPIQQILVTEFLHLVDTPGMVSLPVTELGLTLINYAVLKFLLHLCLVYWVDFLGFISIPYRSCWVIDWKLEPCFLPVFNCMIKSLCVSGCYSYMILCNYKPTKYMVPHPEKGRMPKYWLNWWKKEFHTLWHGCLYSGERNDHNWCGTLKLQQREDPGLLSRLLTAPVAQLSSLIH